MEVGMTAFFNARHYLTANGDPGEIEKKSWQVEIYLQGSDFGDAGELVGTEETQNDIIQLLAGYNNKLLNNMEPYDTIQPTPENIARTLYSQIRDLLPGKPIRLKGLKVWVSPTRYVWYSESPTDAV